MVALGVDLALLCPPVHRNEDLERNRSLHADYMGRSDPDPRHQRCDAAQGATACASDLDPLVFRDAGILRLARPGVGGSKPLFFLQRTARTVGLPSPGLGGRTGSPAAIPGLCLGGVLSDSRFAFGQTAGPGSE